MEKSGTNLGMRPNGSTYCKNCRRIKARQAYDERKTNPQWRERRNEMARLARRKRNDTYTAQQVAIENFELTDEERAALS